MPAREEARAILSARASKIGDVKLSPELTAQLEDLHPWAQMMLLAHGNGLEQMVARNKGLQTLLSPPSPGHSPPALSAEQTQPTPDLKSMPDVPTAQRSLSNSARTSRKREEAKRPTRPWKPTSSGHACIADVPPVPEEQSPVKPSHRFRGFTMSKTPGLPSRTSASSTKSPYGMQSGASVTHGEDGKSPDAMNKMLYWSDAMGSYVDGGAMADAQLVDATLTTSMFEAGGKLRRNISNIFGLVDDSPFVERMMPPSNWEIWGYKLVAKVGQRYFSLWKGERAEYEIGLPLDEEAMPDRRGGLYICDSPASAARQYIATTFPGNALCVVMLRCACRGPFVDYGGGSAACSSLTPLGEVPLPSGESGPNAGLWQRLYASHPGGAHTDERGRMSMMPGWEVVGYTVVARMGQPPLRERLFSLWSTEAFRYDLGTSARDDSLTERSRDHLWVVSSPSEVASVPIKIAEKLRNSGVDSAPRVLLRCACEGPFVELPDGRMACKKLTPVAEVAAPRREEWQTAEFLPAPPEQVRPARVDPRQRILAGMRAAQGKGKRPQSPFRPASARPRRPASAPLHGRRTLLSQSHEI